MPYRMTPSVRHRAIEVYYYYYYYYYYMIFFLNNISGLHTARMPQDGLLFNLTRKLIMVQNNIVHFILTKTIYDTNT